MTAPLTNAAEVSARLYELSQVQTAVSQELARADQAAVTSRLTYDEAYSRAFITGEGSMDLRRQMALLKAHDKRVAAETADLMVRNLRRRLASLQMEFESCRSIGAAIRAEATAFGGGVR